jgi:hypothetical protein
MKTPSKPLVIGSGVVFLSALGAQCLADPFGSHDTLPRSAMTIGTGTTATGSIGPSYVAIYPTNVVTDEDYTPALLPVWAKRTSTI